MQVLSISSQVAWSPVGNSAAIPVMMQKAIEVIGLPTVILSNHPGFGQPAGLSLDAEKLSSMLAKLEGLGVLENLSGILTGYFAHAEQVDVMAQFITRHAQALYLCDPVIGDDPKGLYVPESVAIAIRDKLLPLAHILTPNRFEAEWLGNLPSNIKERILTSIPDGDGLITRLESEDLTLTHRSFRREHVPHGTGDLLAGLYLANRLREAKAQAFHVAMARLEAVIARSAGGPSLVLHP